MPHDAVGGVGRSRGDPGARGRRPLVRAAPGGGTRLTPPRRAALAFGATLLLTALVLGTFPGAAAPAARAAGFGLAALGLLLGWSRPALATCVLAAAVPIGMGLPRLLGDRSGAPVLPAVALAVLGGALSRRLSRGEPSRLPPALLAFASAFLVLAAGSTLLSIARGETLYLLLHGRADPLVVNVLGMTAASRTRDALLTFVGLVLLLLALDVFSRLSLDAEGRDRLFLFACAGGAAALLVAAVERFRPLDPALPWSALERRAGTFTDPNALGVGVGLLVPLFIAALPARGSASDGGRRAAAIAGLLAAPVALESSGSRTGLLLLGAAAFFAGIGFLRRRRASPLVLAAIAAALLGTAVLAVRLLPRGGAIASGGLVNRLGAALSARDFSSFANHRVTFWRTAFEMTADEPLSGIGLAGFPYEFPAAYAKRHGPIGVTDGATNALLDVSAECGVPGLLLALFAVVPLLARAFDAAFARAPSDPVCRASGAALAGLFVACQTGSHTRFFEIGLLASLTAAFLLVPRRSAREARTPIGEGWRPARTAGILAGAGLLGAAIAALPTARPDAPFHARLWAGVYPAAAGEPFHWATSRAYRGIRPGETSVSFRIQNARPDGAALTVRAEVLGRRETSTSLDLAGGETRDVSIDVPPGGEVVRLTTNRDFVPRELVGSGDARRLAVRVAGEGL